MLSSAYISTYFIHVKIGKGVLSESDIRYRDFLTWLGTSFDIGEESKEACAEGHNGNKRRLEEHGELD